MTTPVIIDAIAGAVLLGFCILGACRGLFRSLAGLVIVVIALVGAAMIATTFAPPAAKLVAPLVRERVTQRVEEAVGQRDDAFEAEELPAEITELLELVGLDENVRQELAQQAEKTVETTGADIAAAVVESLVQSIIYGILYILSFLGLTLLLRAILKAMDLVFHLPGLRLLNGLGGAIFGFAEGGLLVFLAVWLLRRFGVSIPAELVADTHLFWIFTTYTPLSVLSLLY